MAQLPIGFNTPENNQGMDDYTALPAGKYLAQIKKSEYKETKAKTGHYLQLNLVVLEGKYKGRILFERLNLDNPNPIAVEIANKTLNSICKACDKVGVMDSEELHAIPMEVTIKVNPATATQPESNDVQAYKKYSGEAIADPAEPSPDSGAASSDTPKKKLPWS